ncbi:DUF2232 domain-containing protein [Thiomicrospira sp. R3]|uniref:DUF2232 domain-containing protein n=1 Tax=Thiomicrospira sp. R3 TaxID=3035472 RepID=UPI00259BD2FB|nr:DUF2232 domain-containing protein [Thiomicrospira sp. R3]WFE68581.1 DUF2232 domain-containing protein [Thiomicrospira sp. R3]
MIAIANFVMKGPMQAYLSAIAFALLAIWFTPIGFLAGAIIALVTLRVGVVDGLKVMAAAAFVHIGLSSLLSGSYLAGLVVMLEFMLPVWILALVLRQTNSLGTTLQFAGIMAAVGLVIVHLLIGDMPGWWMNLFNQAFKPVLDQAEVAYSIEMIEQMSNVMTMLLAMFAVVLWFTVLLAGRWWQGELYYPGQFQQDFHQIRLPRNVAYATAFIAIASIFFNESSGGLLGDLFGLLTVVLMFQGLAIAHFSILKKEMSNGWLVGLYILLAVFPQTVLVLSILGLADNFMDFRSRWIESK